jgi:integrase
MLTPDRTIRIPYAPKYKEVEKWLQKLQPRNRIEAIQKASIQLILETGCLAHEASQITAANFECRKQKYFVRISGKNPRKIPVSASLAKAWMEQKNTKPVTSRTIELWVKQVFAQSKSMSKITPRALRHARVLQWMREKKSDSRIMSLLGLKSDYSFRMYRVWFEKLKQKE